MVGLTQVAMYNRGAFLWRVHCGSNPTHRSVNTHLGKAHQCLSTMHLELGSRRLFLRHVVRKSPHKANTKASSPTTDAEIASGAGEVDVQPLDIWNVCNLSPNVITADGRPHSSYRD